MFQNTSHIFLLCSNVGKLGSYKVCKNALIFASVSPDDGQSQNVFSREYSLCTGSPITLKKLPSISVTPIIPIHS